MGSLLTTFGQLMRWPHARAFDRAKDDPRTAQERLLLEILGRNADTEYGRQHGFREILSLEDYARRVPVVSYDDVQERIERMTRGERGVMTAQVPLYYCCTSGTTGTPKFNPVTPDYRTQYQRTVHTFLFHLFRDHPRAGARQVLYFVGGNRLGRTPDGTPYGTMSGFNYGALPSYARRLYAVPFDVFQIQDLELKYYTIARLALLTRLSLGVAITPTPLISFARTLEEHAEELVADVARGSMARAGQLPPDIRAELEPLMAPAPARARELEALRARGELTAPRAWPDLALLTCWIGAAAGLYVPELRRRFPGVTLRDAIYSATEGWCNIPLGDERPGGPAAILSHVYEFIPEDEHERPDRRVLTVDRLEDGKRYFVLLTTGGGMYRYDLKDVLEVCGFHGRTPCLRFAYKGRHACNLAGEKMTEAHVNEAVARFQERRGRSLDFFMAVPREVPGDQGYDLFVETTAELGGAQPELEEALRAVNWEYESHRSCGDLTELRLQRLRPGTWEELRQAMAQEGVQEAQIKPPHLSSKPDLVAALRARVAP